MNEVAILVKPLDYPLTLDNIDKCFNCGGNVFRVKQEWGTLKPQMELPTPMVISIMLYCAVCGESSTGYDLYDREKEVAEDDIDSIYIAKMHSKIGVENEQATKT